MATEAEVRHALLHAQGRSMSDLAAELQVTRQHAHRLLTGRRPSDAREADLDRALALGERPTDGRPAYAIATLTGERLELLPAGDTQPVFASRAPAAEVARRLQVSHPDVCVVPVWPAYAWRHLVAFHAAWGVPPEPKKLFLVAEDDPELPLETLLDELSTGFAETLRLRDLGEDPTLLREVESALDRLH
jgi:hypothetical protein